MAKKLISWKTKGMNRDTSVSAFNPEFAFENYNLRLSTNDGNTRMSWVNEKGTSELTLEIETGMEAEDGDPIYDDTLKGVVIGTAVINSQLVLFTTDENGDDYIYLLYRIYEDGTVRGKYLYIGDLNFKVSYPLETLVSYESSLIQKVYWTDGINPPRFINIAADQVTINNWNFRTTPFDFIPELRLKEEVRVSKIFGSGEFPAGVIQYAFTYYNKYGQESNIFYTTPLQYISYIDRGGSPDSKIANSFKIQVNNLDQNFDYLRIYSILRTSKDATPLVKRIADIQIPELINTESSDTQKARTLSSEDNLKYFGNALAIGSPSKYNLSSKTDEFTVLRSLGGTAVYGNYLFQVYSNGMYMDIINLKTGSKISELNGIDTGGPNFQQYSTLSFGKELAPNSMFPYLYCSYANISLSRIVVFKVTSSWKLERVSTIYLPMDNGYSQNSTSDPSRDPDFIHYWQNACIDAENHCIWVSGYSKSSHSSNSGNYEDNKLIYKKYNLPATSFKDYYLNSLDVQDSFSLPFKAGAQAMVISDNKLYQCFSHKEGTTVEMYLTGIDLGTKKESKSYKIAQDTFTQNKAKVMLKSPYIYNGEMYLTTEYEEYDYYLIWRTAFSSSNTDGGITSNPDVLNPSEITFIDTGLQGDTIDPTELLYKGGEEIIVQTLEQKDGTLFLGNIVSKRPPLDIKNNLLEANGVVKDNETYPLIQDNVDALLESRSFNLVSKEPFTYINTLSGPANTSYQGAAGFKGGEYYRLGVQFQYKNGKWSEPCWIGDKQQTKYPKVNNKNNGILGIPVFKYTIDDSKDGLADIFKTLYKAGYRRVRPVFAVPGSSDRTILLQGVGCPTMWRKIDRYADAKKGSGSYTSWSGSKEGKLYAQSSWLFRMPNDILTSKYFGDASNGGGKVSYEGKLQSQFDTPFISDQRLGDGISPFLRSTEIMGVYDDGHVFYIDDMLATIHTPDVTFDTSLYSMDFTNCGMEYVGTVGFGNTFGDIDIQTSTPAIGSDAGGFVHRSIVTDGAAALITAPFYNDYLVDDQDDNGKYGAYSIDHPCIDYPVYLWQKNGSLNNDVNRDNSSAVLLKKKISNYRYGDSTTYSDQSTDYKVKDIQLFSSDELSAVKVDGHVYMGNIETMLTPTTPSPHYLIGYPWRTTVDTGFDSDCYYRLALKDPTNAANSDYGVWALVKEGSGYKWDPPSGDDHHIGDYVKGLDQWREGIMMKYKSTPHIVVKLEGNPSLVATNAGIYGPIIDNNNVNMMPLIEVTKSYDKDIFFGGTSDEALRTATWIPCGLPVSFTASTHILSVNFNWGDTYFQRFECLKTYPFTSEDKNQVVEIASFMVETRVNIDGRYDRNRAQTSNLNMTPQNFNLLNPVYSQIDNFFSYKMLDEDDYKNVNYPNNITWTKTKESGADVDLWTNITMANTLEMDGDKGEITKLVRLNNQLLCFQDSGISQILYNENTQISTTEGVPIEIANSQKVQGKRYLSDTVGCSNKWSMAQTPNGIYFMDSNEKSIYLFNGQLNNLSTTGGFNSWSKQYIPSSKDRWNPVDFNNFRAFYDKQNQDVLFVDKQRALAYSEKFNCFTSFYDYGSAPFFENLDDMGIWIKDSKLWLHQDGEYCNFFGNNKSFSMTIIANQEPQMDKIFTNLEFRACVSDEGTYDKEAEVLTPSLPFDSLEVWDEYQHGIATLNHRNKGSRFEHGILDSILARKFRIWRCDIPRDNATVDAATECPLGIKRFKARPLDRIRNTWAYLKLSKNAAKEGSLLSKVEVHDIVASYFA